jgi:hypothetical protein
VKHRFLLLLPAACALSACVELPTEPTVAVMPPPYKPFDLFVADEQACKAYAGQVVAQPEAANSYYYYPQYRFNVAYEQCMYSRGNQVPGFGGSTPPHSGTPPQNQPPPAQH